MKEFKEYVLEMTMSFAQDNYLSMQDFSNAEHIGDIEQSRVLYKKINGFDFYAITEGDNPDKSIDFDPNRPISYVQVQNQKILEKDYLEIRNIFTEKKYRGQNYAKKLLFFLRNIEKKSFVFGDIQSKLGQGLVKSVGKSGRFPMFWLNINTGEKHDYEVEKDNFYIKPYRDIVGPTGWVVIAEASGRDFSSRFLIESDINYWHRFIQWFPAF